MRIISREQHNISRKNISSAALKVLYRLRDEGFAAFLVGGAVRDLQLGGNPKDFDVATDATPEDVRRLFRNCRLIGRRFRLAHVVFGREIIEVATFRGPGDEAGEGAESGREIVDGRILRDNVWGTIEEDALRRDFRVNALYYDIADFSIRDYVGGMEDLADRVLHLIGDASQRYREDPVRMLRAVRLAAKLDFTIGDDAAQPIADLGALVAAAPPARLFDESLKMFLAGHGLSSLRLLRRYDLLRYLFPATERALKQDADGAYASLLEGGLASTDARVNEGKSTTPAFLFALLLWGDVRRRASRSIEDGVDVALAWQRASDKVIVEQTAAVAIPRRFLYAMEEIWALQLRFHDIGHRKRVSRLLAHPRFRAAYDFLMLRAGESPAIAELGAWWTRAQDLPQESLHAELVAQGTGEGLPPARRKRRRRRKPGSGSNA